VYGAGRRFDQMLPGEVGRRLGLLQGALDLAGGWRDAVGKAEGDKVVLGELVAKDVLEWEGHAKKAMEGRGKGDGEEDAPGAVYIAGGMQASPADFALWPVLHDMVRECGDGVLDADGDGGHLRRYYEAFGERGSVKKALGLDMAKEEGLEEAKKGKAKAE
jgi:hypothetical protein